MKEYERKFKNIPMKNFFFLFYGIILNANSRIFEKNYEKYIWFEKRLDVNYNNSLDKLGQS